MGSIKKKTDLISLIIGFDGLAVKFNGIVIILLLSRVVNEL